MHGVALSVLHQHVTGAVRARPRPLYRTSAKLPPACVTGQYDTLVRWQYWKVGPPDLPFCSAHSHPHAHAPSVSSTHTQIHIHIQILIHITLHHTEAPRTSYHGPKHHATHRWSAFQGGAQKTQHLPLTKHHVPRRRSTAGSTSTSRQQQHPSPAEVRSHTPRATTREADRAQHTTEHFVNVSADVRPWSKYQQGGTRCSYTPAWTCRTPRRDAEQHPAPPRTCPDRTAAADPRTRPPADARSAGTHSWTGRTPGQRRRQPHTATRQTAIAQGPVASTTKKHVHLIDDAPYLQRGARGEVASPVRVVAIGVCLDAQPANSTTAREFLIQTSGARCPPPLRQPKKHRSNSVKSPRTREEVVRLDCPRQVGGVHRVNVRRGRRVEHVDTTVSVHRLNQLVQILVPLVGVLPGPNEEKSMVTCPKLATPAPRKKPRFNSRHYPMREDNCTSYWKSDPIWNMMWPVFALCR